VPNVTTIAYVRNSGAPGYLKGYPLLIGIPNLNIIAALTIQLPVQGYWIKGVNNVGTCLFNPNPVGDVFDSRKIPLFFEQRTTTCQMSFNISSALSSFCTQSNFLNMELFNNFNQSVYFGKFGNSNINWGSDWVNMTDVQPMSSYSVSSTGNTCTFPNKETIAVYYAIAGLPTNPQTYIVQVLRTFQSSTLNFNPNLATNTFTFSSNIVFVQIPQSNINMIQKYADYFASIFQPLKTLHTADGEVLRVSLCMIACFVMFLALQ